MQGSKRDLMVIESRREAEKRYHTREAENCRITIKTAARPKQ